MMKKSMIAMLAMCLFSAAVVAQAEKQLVLKIPQMTCQLCVYLVNKELRAVDGVLATKANFKEQSVKVTVRPQLDPQKLIQAVDKLQYHAELVE